MAVPVSLWPALPALPLVMAVTGLSARRPAVLLFFALMLLDGLLAAALGLGLLTGQLPTVSHSLVTGLPGLAWHLRLDPLSGWFLLLIGLVQVAVAPYGPGYVRELLPGHRTPGALGFFTALFLLGMQLVVVADDAFLFMIAWELMSLSSYVLVVFHHQRSENRRAGFLYLLMAHVGALAILLAFGVLATHGHGFAFDTLRSADVPPLWSTVAFVLALVGFGMKAGVLPLHVWLPEAHPVAPSHVSALMSGVMLKVAVYGFVRFTFDLCGAPALQTGWGVALLTVGSLTALYGVLFALMQHDIKRLLAYHSVENIGIIFLGLGLAVIFRATGHPGVAAVALAAALYHTLNHALFKSLLFLGAGAVMHSTHERDIERMGGLLRRMPWTGTFFLVGCLSISALPPFNGFVSEWLTFQAALQTWVLDSGLLRSLLPIAAAMLALTGALAAACFVKVYGVVFLGQGRSRHARHARRVPRGMRAGQAWLALLCVLFGILPVPIVRALGTITGPILGDDLHAASVQGLLWLTPISPKTASYGPPLVVLALGLTWWLTARLLRRGRARGVVSCEPWDCGFSRPTPRMQYTATSFAQPILRVFRVLFDVEEGLEERGGIHYHLHVRDRLWRLLYEPIGRGVLGAARQVARLQSGRLRAYLAGSFATLLMLLWVIGL
ncbi:MAG: hydrogenase 4 subunit B [Gammaproteobacteria bacterium]|nr:MAG: hydrogenase 4 subunit B [Gammaproteobacteria bacterium]